MSSMLLALLVPLWLAILLFCFVLIRAALAARAKPTPESMLLGAVVSFFDTLGIGSFAPTAAWMKLRGLVPDQLIPPTMLVGLTPPVMVQSVVFLGLIEVDPVLVFGCALAVLLGGLVGAPLVVKTRVWIVQLIVAIALVLAAIAYTATNIGLMEDRGTLSSLPPGLTILAIAANFLFGVLLNFGVGNYAPTLVTLGLMGLNTRLIFPIMAAGAAMMGAGACVRHIQMGRMDLKVVVGLGIGGIPAVIVAAFLVSEKIPLELLRWGVIAVVLYAAAIMFRAAVLGRREHKAEPATAAVAAD